MGILVKLLGRGIGFTSEAMHAYRSNSNFSREGTRSPNPAGASSSTSPPPLNHAPPEYVEIADEAAAEELIRSGRAERVIDYNDETKGRGHSKEKGKQVNGEEDSDTDSSADTDIGADDAVWELDEAAERAAPPSYGESEAALDAEAEAMAGQPEEAKMEKEEQMVRELVKMAGPIPTPPKNLPCPVILPQRRPRNKDRGFVRAYAPVLQESGIGQDMWLKFLDNWLVASKADKWIDVVFISAHIVGYVPEMAAQIVSTVVQVAAGTAKELQSRTRRNGYLDRVNEEIFMPRGMYGMIMAFKNDVQGQQRGPLSKLAGTVGTLFASERLDIDQTAAKFASPEARNKTKNKLRLASGKTVGELELPQAAELVYPNLDRAIEEEVEGKGKEKSSFKEKMAGGMAWVADYADRRARQQFNVQNLNSPLSVPSSAEKPFQSRYNDPNHSANSGSLISLLTGGHINPFGGRNERRAAKREARDARRVARGREPRGPLARLGPDGKTQYRKRQRRPGVIKKLLQQDVLYFIVVSLPTEEELQEGVARLEGVLSRQGTMAQ